MLPRSLKPRYRDTSIYGSLFVLVIFVESSLIFITGETEWVYGVIFALLGLCFVIYGETKRREDEVRRARLQAETRRRLQVVKGEVGEP